MFQSLNIQHWLILAVLILACTIIFGCLFLQLTEKIILF